ncbi:MAG: energy transducer TonB [Deltaproteobacteria bacterium]|nr:energy transducer TonB [Deltaproteobacteria bacterium]MBW2099999.1 energy transducer TonB [Deltaproteobacteria bacterium]
MMPYLRFSSQRLRALTLWGGAVLFSVILNIALFSFMPTLRTPIPDRHEYITPVRITNIVRVKRPEEPPKKKKIKKEIVLKRTVSLGKKSISGPVSTHKQTVRMTKLPFEINPRLPGGPGTLPTPPMETVDVPLSELKGVVQFSGTNGDGLNGIYEIEELDASLIPIVKVPPLYPTRARQKGIEGWVKVKFLITEQGLVGKIEIQDAQPKRIFDQSVIRSLSSWRFSPATVDGVPVKVWAMTTIVFELE